MIIFQGDSSVNTTRIVIADDEIHITHLLSHKLKQAGHDVLVANDGQEAFDLISKILPDLVITDFQMPVMDGYEIAVKLKNQAKTQQIPLMMLTGLGHKLTPQQLTATNIKYLISKPFSARNLICKATTLLKQTQQTNQSCHWYGQNAYGERAA